MSDVMVKLPPEQLPMSKKTESWRKQHLDWASSRDFANYSPVRKSVIHKKINYDLLNGKLHMKDLEYVLNPEQIDENVTPAVIQHYPIMNSKLNVLRGEELARIFDFRVVITNPNAVSEKESAKRDEVLSSLQDLLSKYSQDEEAYNKKLEELGDYFTYEWQDMREVRANRLLTHYVKEYNMPLMFNKGFMDAMAIGEEIYQCDIRGGEPIIEKINPLKIRVFKSGYSNRIEDADIVILEDYWSPAKIYDAYYDDLKPKDREYIDKCPTGLDGYIDDRGVEDERRGFINKHMISEEFTANDMYWNPFGVLDDVSSDLMPFDTNGNIRVIRMYWKSRRKIKKVKSYDPETGEVLYNFYSEKYIVDEDKGEEEQVLYINEAWEGTKIGKDIYINMRPRVVQYNSMSNPSRCHFGIVGTIYNLNDDKPYSMVDMMKSYSYLYDVIHDRLNKAIARNWGKIIQVDLAKIPKGWTMDKFMYFAKHNNVAFIDSFREGNVGAATGKLAGALNNNSTGVIDAELSNAIMQYTNLLEFIKQEMSDVAGISKQREGQISNRETVGGVERATLQSSHITEWLFQMHDDTKRRALNVFIETAKIALKGRKEKFSYILGDGSEQIVDIDGDEFAECDYGLVVDNSNGTQDLNQKLDMLAQAALQNQTINFSTIMKLYSSASIVEKQRMVERNEKELMQQQQEQQQQQQQLQQQQIEQAAQTAQQQMEMQYQMHTEDNENKIQVALINAQAEADRLALMNHDEEEVYTQKDKDDLAERIREFDAKLKLDREKLAFDRDKAKTDARLKEKQINKSKVTSK